MIITTYAILFILIVVAITYPKEFPELMRNPQQLIEVTALESKRRWMLLKLGTQLWISKKQMQYSHWKMRGIIEQEKQKQQSQENNK